MHTHTRWKTNNAKTVSKVLSRQTGTVEQLYMYNDTWALLVIESASSRMIILKGGQGWPLCGCVGVREEGCVCMVVRGKGRGEGRWEYGVQCRSPRLRMAQESTFCCSALFSNFSLAMV